MTISECVEFHKGLSDIDQIKFYLTVGGIPYYHSVPEFSTYDEYLERYLMRDDSSFSREGENLVNSELSPCREYLKILDAMTGRRNDIKTISDRSGIDRNRCAEYIENMIELGIVSAVNPMLGAQKKPRYYYISDNMIAFHFAVIRRYSPIGMVWSAADLKAPVSMFHGHMFEHLCADILKESYPLTSTGTWWGKRTVDSITEIAISISLRRDTIRRQVIF